MSIVGARSSSSASPPLTHRQYTVRILDHKNVHQACTHARLVTSNGASVSNASNVTTGTPPAAAPSLLVDVAVFGSSMIARDYSCDHCVCTRTHESHECDIAVRVWCCHLERRVQRIIIIVVITDVVVVVVVVVCSSSSSTAFDIDQRQHVVQSCALTITLRTHTVKHAHTHTHTHTHTYRTLASLCSANNSRRQSQHQ